jgi:acetyl esterase/lipase
MSFVDLKNLPATLFTVWLLSVHSAPAQNADKPPANAGSSKSSRNAAKPVAAEGQPLPRHGLYQDFRARVDDRGLWFPKYDADGKATAGSGKRFPGINAVDAFEASLPQSTNLAFTGQKTNWVLHILAAELTEPLIREALANRHVYLAHDEFGDPDGFAFGAVNNLGVFNIGDTVPMLSKTRLMALTPLTAKLRVVSDGAVVNETVGTNLNFQATEAGAYRFEAVLTRDGTDRLWISSPPVNLRSPNLTDVRLPSMEISPEVEAHKNISYREGPEEDAPKHRLDVYSPKGKANAPVFFFIHGGAWKTGDRSYYPPLGNRYARAGYVTVVPSYRLAPKHPHPAQIEDVAAAFAWTINHGREFGGDTNRVYVGGHSAGGHLGALLALDERYLTAYKLSPKNIRGVLALSGVYDLSVGDFQDSVFGKTTAGRRDASPLSYVRKGAPPFLVEFCEWDYFSLPAQARDFHRALQQAGATANLLYISGQSHISEILSFATEDEPIVSAALKFMK